MSLPESHLAQEAIAALVDGELAPGPAHRAARHLSGCLECRLAGSDPGPERAWEHNNLDHDVQAALDTLPPEFRAAVVLCDIEGLSYEEIAATLDVKLGTVRSRIHRGRAALRQALAHRRPDLGDPAARGAAAVAPGGEPAL